MARTSAGSRAVELACIHGHDHDHDHDFRPSSITAPAAFSPPPNRLLDSFASLFTSSLYIGKAIRVKGRLKRNKGFCARGAIDVHITRANLP